MLGEGPHPSWAHAGRGQVLPLTHTPPPDPMTRPALSTTFSCGAKTAVHGGLRKCRLFLPALPSRPALPCLLLPPPSLGKPEGRGPQGQAVPSWGSGCSWVAGKEKAGGGKGKGKAPGLRCCRLVWEWPPN